MTFLFDNVIPPHGCRQLPRSPIHGKKNMLFFRILYAIDNFVLWVFNP